MKPRCERLNGFAPHEATESDEQQMTRDDIAGKTAHGKVVAGEFVSASDEDGREPGTYVTIRFDDPDAVLVGGPVAVTYLPLPPRAVTAEEVRGILKRN